MRNYLVRIAVLLVFPVGCDDVRNPEFCGDGFCIDESLPFCDKDGTIGPKKQANTCIAVSCQPGEFIACRDNETIACNSTGDNFDVLECASGCIQGSATCTPCSPGETRCRKDFLESCGTSGTFQVAETCDLSCVATPTPHCAYVEPKYIPDACDVPATQDVQTYPSSTFDTALDMNCTGGVIAQSAGPSICVVRAKSIAIPVGVTLTVVGPRALALIGDASVDVSGTLDVSATGTANGPGAGIGTTGSGANISANSLGGGGAGFATSGAPGGTLTTAGGGSSGGPASTNPSQLTTLIGGSKGGGNAGSLGGGGGGGALVLVACRGTLMVSGTVEANGGGAAPATNVQVGMFQAGSPGYGGGSGGNVVLQGMAINVTGRLFANGGGGGSGNDSAFNEGSPGNDGASTGGTGGPGVRNNGVGGNGGGQSNPSPGNPPIGGLPRTPGGGGSVGFLQTYTPNGVTPMLNPTAASPSLQPNLEARTR